MLFVFLFFAGAKTYFAFRPVSAPAAGDTAPKNAAAPFHLKLYVLSRTSSAYDMDLNVFGMRVAAQVLGFFDPFHFYSVEEVCQGDALPPVRPGVIVVTHEYYQTINGSWQDTGLILVPGPMNGAAHLNATGRFHVAPPDVLESPYGSANVFYCGKLGPGTLGTFGVMRTLIARSCAENLVWRPFWPHSP